MERRRGEGLNLIEITPPAMEEEQEEEGW